SSAFGPHPDLPSFPTRRSSDLPRLPELFRQSLSVAARQGRRVILRGHPDTRRKEIGSAIQSGLRRLERRPAPVFFMPAGALLAGDRKSTRLNSSHLGISYAVFC